LYSVYSRTDRFYDWRLFCICSRSLWASSRTNDELPRVYIHTE
jgi:hypothetical protein